jgi:hypothetical protein
MADEMEDVPQPIETVDAPPSQPGVAPLASGDEPPPTKPLSAISLYLEDNYDELMAEIGDVDESIFKAEVRKRYKSLPKDQRSQYKARAKAAKETYFESLEVYLVSHPTHEVDEKDREGLEKHREKVKRKMEEAQIEEPPVQKKKKKKRKKSVRDRGERREESPQPVEFQDEGMDQEGRYDDPDIPKLPKSRRGGKKKKYDAEDDEQAKQILTNLCTQMKQAADKDRNLNRLQRPAVEKLKLLKKAVTHLELRHFHQYIIEKLEMLDVIRDWLTVLPDGSLPEMNVRNAMYRVLELFELEKYEPGDIRDYFLMSSQRTETLINQDPSKRVFKPFCKTIKFLCAHPKETVGNRQRLKKMIMRWCRPLVGSPSTQGVPTESATIVSERNQQLRSRKRYIDTLKSKRARLPQKPWFDFSRNAPKADISQLQTQSHDDGRRAVIERTFRQLGKKGRTSGLASVSINGKFSFK